MKYLQDYQEERQTALFNSTGAFFAFSQSQFNEGKKEGIKYVNCQGGMICPKDNVIILIEGLDQIYKEAIQQDIKENGKEAIIKRELYNYECFYTYDTKSAVDALHGYGFTDDDIIAVFNTEKLLQD